MPWYLQGSVHRTPCPNKCKIYGINKSVMNPNKPSRGDQRSVLVAYGGLRWDQLWLYVGPGIHIKPYPQIHRCR